MSCDSKSFSVASDESSAGAGEEADGEREELWGGGGGGGGVGVGRLVDSSQADDRRMIALVRARRLLYARNNMPVASFYARVKKLWEEVADEMGRSVAEVRRKWSHIRNSYSRHLRNEVGGARTGRGRAVSRWYLADELEFLKEHMATDTRTFSSPPVRRGALYAPTTFLQVDLAESAAGGAGGGWLASPPPAPPTPPPPPAASAARLEPKQEPHSVYSGGDDSCSSFAAAPDEEVSYFQFFRGVYGEYCGLSCVRRRLYRRQCLALLHALLDEQDAALAPAPAPAPGAPDDTYMHAPSPHRAHHDPGHILPNTD